MLQRARTPLLRRAAAGAAATLVLTAGSLLLAGPASAHVTVNPREAAAGGYQKLSVRVPNESPTASTVKVQVSLPLDTPLASVSLKPHPGWTAKVTRSTLPQPVQSGDLQLTEAVSAITWTAQSGAKVAPGQFEEFDISVGPLPDGVPALSFPAVQTYDDGEVVRWDQAATSTGEEPEHPAPTLTLTPAADAEPAAPTPGVAPVSDAQGTAPAAAPTQVDSSDGTARALGAGGLAVGVLGLGAAAAATMGQRRGREI